MSNKPNSYCEQLKTIFTTIKQIKNVKFIKLKNEISAKTLNMELKININKYDVSTF